MLGVIIAVMLRLMVEALLFIALILVLHVIEPNLLMVVDIVEPWFVSFGS